MESVSQTQKKYGSRAMIVAIVIAFMLILIDLKPVGKGLVLGTIFSVINFVLIGQTLPMRLSKSKRGAFLISLTSIVFRYAILSIPLVVAVKFEQFELPAAILGIFMVQLTILAESLFDLFTSRENQT
ncbi:MAG: ATP synthase subunit I [Desulfobacterales bacterium]|nr:ATP synthase subunit I [Desulfobacterales bacterium]